MYVQTGGDRSRFAGFCLDGNELLYSDADNFLTSSAAISLLRMTALYGV
jgi:hypothetical protein